MPIYTCIKITLKHYNAKKKRVCHFTDKRYLNSNTQYKTE